MAKKEVRKKAHAKKKKHKKLNRADKEDPKTWKTKVPFHFRLTTKERIFFFKYMGAMSEAGIPLEKSLEAIHKQTKSTVMHRVLHIMIDDVNSGEFLTTSMKKVPHIFDRMSISLISVGEMSGTLTNEFYRIAEHLDKRRELKNKILAALLYPAVVFVGAIGVTLYLLFFLVPQLTPLFLSLNVELPLSTRIVIALSNFFLAYGLFLLIGIIILTIIGFFIVRTEKGRYFVEYVIFKIPLLGKMMLKVQTTIFTRIVGTLLNSGLTIVDAFQVASDSMSNRVFRRELTIIAESIEEGRNISSHLAENINIFSPIVTQMISVGEQTGKLDDMFLFIADFSEKEVDDTTKTLTSLMEPLLLLFLGGVVGFIAVSIITPIYSLTASLS